MIVESVERFKSLNVILRQSCASLSTLSSVTVTPLPATSKVLRGLDDKEEESGSVDKRGFGCSVAVSSQESSDLTFLLGVAGGSYKSYIFS